MKIKHKSLFILFLIMVCLATALFSFAGCASIKDIIEVQQRADIAANRGNAAIIAQALNTHNAISDDSNVITELPETKAELDAMDLVVSVTMEEDDYQNALPYVVFDDEDGFSVLDEK